MDRVDWEISYDPELKRDVVIIDTGDDIITLTKRDLEVMLKELCEYE